MNEAYTVHNLKSAQGQRPELTVIIVNHESWPDVLRLTSSLTSEPEFSSGRCQIVVVDNASRGASLPEAFSSLPIRSSAFGHQTRKRGFRGRR